MNPALLEPNIPTCIATGTDRFSRLVRGLHGDNALRADGLEARLRAAGCTILRRVTDDKPEMHPFKRTVTVTTDVGLRVEGEAVEVDYDVNFVGITVLIDGHHLTSATTWDVHHEPDRVIPRRVHRFDAIRMLQSAEAQVAALEASTAYVESMLEIEVEDDDTEDTLAVKSAEQQMGRIEDLLTQREAELIEADTARCLLRTALTTTCRHETIIVIGRPM